MNTDYASDVWQRLFTLVNQHPVSQQSNLKQRDKKIAMQRWLSENVLACLLQYIGLTMTMLSLQPYPVWFAAGTASGFVFLRGTSVLPGIFLGSVVAFLGAKAPLLLALGCAVLLALQAYALLTINYRAGNVSLVFHRLSAFIQFIIGMAILTAVTAMLLALLCHSALWFSWWLANFNGILILACAIVTWDAYFTQMDRLQKRDYWQIGFLFVLLILACLAVLCNHGESIAMPGIVLLTAGIAGRFGWCGVVGALFVMTCLMTFSLSITSPVIMTLHPVLIPLCFAILSVFSMALCARKPQHSI